MGAFPQGGGFQNQGGFGMQRGAYAGMRGSAGCQVGMGILFALIGLGVLVFGVSLYSSIQQLHTSHATTVGNLGNCSTTTTHNGNGSSSTSTTCTVTYTVNGSQYSISTSADTVPGQVTVYYEPSKPSNAEIAQQYNGINTGIWVILFGAVFFLIGGATAVSAVLRRLRAGL